MLTIVHDSLDSVLVFGDVAPERPRMEYLSYLRASKVSEPFFQPVAAAVLERINELRERGEERALSACWSSAT